MSNSDDHYSAGVASSVAAGASVVGGDDQRVRGFNLNALEGRHEGI